MSQTLKVVSRDPDMAVFGSDILRHLTVDVWPRRVCRHTLSIVSRMIPQTTGEWEEGFGIPSEKIPYPDVPVTSTTDQDVFPRNHGPYAHNVALQCLLSIALGIENVDLGVIKRHDDVLWRQVKTGHHPSVLGDILGDLSAARLPGGVN